MHPSEQLAYILPTLSSMVDRIDAGQLGDPTPCERFDVLGVLDHMLTLGGAFVPMFRGEDVSTATPPPEYDGSVPAAAFRKVMDDLLDAVRSDGAMERTVQSPVGEMSGETFARLVAFDGLVHGWDIAAGTGQAYELPGCVVACVDEFARAAIGPEMRDGDTFKEETVAPNDASALERLVAFSGRTL